MKGGGTLVTQIGRKFRHNGQAADIDGIPEELIEYGSEEVMNIITYVNFLENLARCQMVRGWQRLYLYKGKGRQECKICR